MNKLTPSLLSALTDGRLSYSLRSLMFFITATCVLFFVSLKSGQYLPFVLPLAFGLTIFAAANNTWLYLWMLAGGLLAELVFMILILFKDEWEVPVDGTTLIFVLGAYLGLTASTRKLGLVLIGLVFVYLGTFVVL